MSLTNTNYSGTGGLAFSNSFVRVVQEIMHASVNVALSAENANEALERSYPSFVTGLMILHGEKDMVLTLTFSKEAAADIVVTMLGAKYNQLEENDVYDAVMEITNMIAGRLKTATLDLGTSYQLTTPLIFVGPRHFLGAKARPAGIVKRFSDKKFQMLGSIYFL